MKDLKLSGNRIKDLRESRKLLQQDIARRLHKSQSTYSRMENRHTSVTLSEAAALCEILECSIADLLDPAGTACQQHTAHPAAGQPAISPADMTAVTYSIIESNNIILSKLTLIEARLNELLKI